MAPLIQNKKARFNYEILETYEAGIELLGSEVKSLKKSSGSLEGAHVISRGSEVFLVGATIPPYQPSNTDENYDPIRPRKLLLTKKEIEEISEKENQKGLTIVPLSMYNKGRLIKIEVAVARGKKKYDKREDLKKQTMKRDVEREITGH